MFLVDLPAVNGDSSSTCWLMSSASASHATHPPPSAVPIPKCDGWALQRASCGSCKKTGDRLGTPVVVGQCWLYVTRNPCWLRINLGMILLIISNYMEKSWEIHDRNPYQPTIKGQYRSGVMLTSDHFGWYHLETCSVGMGHHPVWGLVLLPGVSEAFRSYLFH